MTFGNAFSLSKLLYPRDEMRTAMLISEYENESHARGAGALHFAAPFVSGCTASAGIGRR